MDLPLGSRICVPTYMIPSADAEPARGLTTAPALNVARQARAVVDPDRGIVLCVSHDDALPHNARFRSLPGGLSHPRVASDVRDATRVSVDCPLGWVRFHGGGQVRHSQLPLRVMSWPRVWLTARVRICHASLSCSNTGVGDLSNAGLGRLSLWVSLEIVWAGMGAKGHSCALLELRKLLWG